MTEQAFCVTSVALPPLPGTCARSPVGAISGREAGRTGASTLGRAVGVRLWVGQESKREAALTHLLMHRPPVSQSPAQPQVPPALPQWSLGSEATGKGSGGEHGQWEEARPFPGLQPFLGILSV